MNYLVINDKTKLEDVSPELRKLYLMYRESLEERSHFTKLQDKHIQGRITDDQYNKRCKDLVKGVKFLSYRKDQQVFQVQVRWEGKVSYVGSTRSFDEALHLLSDYVAIKFGEL